MQVIITKSRRIQDVYLRPHASAVIIDRSSPFGGGKGGVSVGAYAITYQHGAPCPSPGFWAPALKHLNGRWFIFVTGHRPDVPGESNLVSSTLVGGRCACVWQHWGTKPRAHPA